MTDGIEMVDVDHLKWEISYALGTGYAADEVLCKDIIRCIDRHIIRSVKK